MKKKGLAEPVDEKVYFTINPKPRMLFEIEKITVVDGQVTKTEKFDPTYLQIVLGNIYKETINKATTP